VAAGLKWGLFANSLEFIIRKVCLDKIFGVGFDISQCSFPINNDGNPLEATPEEIGIRKLTFALAAMLQLEWIQWEPLLT
jgi:hypothetical protein